MEDNYEHYNQLLVLLTSLELARTEFSKLPWYKKLFRKRKFLKETESIIANIYNSVDFLYDKPYVSAALILYLEYTYLKPLKYSGIVRRLRRNGTIYEICTVTRVRSESAMEIAAVSYVPPNLEKNVSVIFGPLTYFSKNLTIGEISYTVRTVTDVWSKDVEYFTSDLKDFEDTLKIKRKLGDREEFILGAINHVLRDTVSIMVDKGLTGEPVTF